MDLLNFEVQFSNSNRKLGQLKASKEVSFRSRKIK